MNVSRNTLIAAQVAADVARVEAGGGVVARYCMAYQPGYGNAVTPSVGVHLGVSDWLHRVFAGSGPWTEGPHDRRVLARGRAWRALAPEARAARKRLGADGSDRLVVYDDDMGLAPASPLGEQRTTLSLSLSGWVENATHFEALLQAAARRRHLAWRPVVRQFVGYDRAASLDLMEATTVYVDANLVGLEAGVFEFCLFGAVPVISDTLVGAEL